MDFLQYNHYKLISVVRVDKTTETFMKAYEMAFEKYFRKLMGWCPNAKTLEARQHVNLENFNSDVPDRSSGEGGDTKSMGWLRKASTPILLFDIFFTLVYFLVLNRIGLNLMIFLLVGFSVIVHTAFYWKSQMQDIMTW